jgi:hypothetical protein
MLFGNYRVSFASAPVSLVLLGNWCGESPQHIFAAHTGDYLLRKFMVS